MSNNQRIIALIIVVLLIIGGYWYLATRTQDYSESGEAQLPNPATVYCIEVRGGTHEIQETPDGQVGICNLPDGRRCEEWQLFNSGLCQPPPDLSEYEEPSISISTTSAEMIEQTGFNFILDSIRLASLEPDSGVRDRVYRALTKNAQENISPETIVRDIIKFLGVQNIPDQGASVEDLQIESESRATLIVGLNYSDLGQVLRAIVLVAEDGVFKVDEVYPLETQYDKGGIEEE